MAPQSDLGGHELRYETSFLNTCAYIKVTASDLEATVLSKSIIPTILPPNLSLLHILQACTR